jgi:hypothetical protein
MRLTNTLMMMALPTTADLARVRSIQAREKNNVDESVLCNLYRLLFSASWVCIRMSDAGGIINAGSETSTRVKPRRQPRKYNGWRPSCV